MENNETTQTNNETTPINNVSTPINNENNKSGNENNQEHNRGGNALTKILLGVLLIGLANIYLLHFISATPSKHNPNATAPIVSQEGAIKIAYINTDTLMAKYQYAIDLQKELETYQRNTENKYKQMMEQFQQDYQNYLKTGEQLTLSEQQRKETELQQRAEKLKTLEGDYTLQIQQKVLRETEKMTNAVYAFIREYNEANQNFDIILSRSFSSSPVLYGNPGMDITNEILEGLNEEYARVKENK